jgi:hypothetical protein
VDALAKHSNDERISFVDTLQPPPHRTRNILLDLLFATGHRLPSLSLSCRLADHPDSSSVIAGGGCSF